MVADEKHPAKAQGDGVGQGLANEVGALNSPGQGEPQLTAGKVVAVVAHGQQQVCSAPGPAHVQLHPGGIHQGLLAHRLHNAAGSQNGDAAYNAQVGIEGPLPHLFPAGDGNDHLHAAGGPLKGLRHRRLDHLPGHVVNGCGSHWLVQTRLCHPAHPGAAVDPMALGMGRTVRK